ncbi:MAG: hypothetical protein A2V67_13860 [Deltaproteobacteria bacterium RBG_13_61_14]|nr:MAG: hypothetical protein A2V67_13860 [Deltaproteobacteria bacterium RBG_13_61_14]
MVLVGLTLVFLAGCAATMSGVEIADVEIQAPVEKVFDYVADYNNLPHYIPEVKRVSNIQGQGLGTTFDWTVESKGHRSQGRTVVVDYVPNQKIVLNSTCGKIITEIFQPLPDGGTRLIVSVFYAAEVPIEGKPVKKIVVKGTREMFEGMVQNIKAEMEK